MSARKEKKETTSLINRGLWFLGAASILTFLNSLAMIQQGNPYGLVDTALMTGFFIGMYKRVGWASTALCVYWIADMVIVTLSDFSPIVILIKILFLYAFVKATLSIRSIETTRKG